MPFGRIFRFIDFNGTENGDKVCTLGPKKLIAAVRLAVRVISKKFKVKHPALRVPPGGNQVDGLPPAFNRRRAGVEPGGSWSIFYTFSIAFSL